MRLAGAARVADASSQRSNELQASCLGPLHQNPFGNPLLHKQRFVLDQLSSLAYWHTYSV